MLYLLQTTQKYQISKPAIMISGMPIIRIHFSGDDFLLAAVGVLDVPVLAGPKPAGLELVG